MVKQYTMWVEIFIMAICPYPIKTDGVFLMTKVVTIPSINWIDNSGLFPEQSHAYETPYFVSDFFLAFMFLRFYFVA